MREVCDQVPLSLVTQHSFVGSPVHPPWGFTAVLTTSSCSTGTRIMSFHPPWGFTAVLTEQSDVGKTATFSFHPPWGFTAVLTVYVDSFNEVPELFPSPMGIHGRSDKDSWAFDIPG